MEEIHLNKISIIVPVYAVEEYLPQCIESILSQTFTDFELILVDDGSPDSCGKICDRFAEKDCRIKVIHQGNGGYSAARNTGIEWSFNNSNSEWILFVDGDDWIAPTCLEQLYKACVDNNVSIANGAQSSDIDRITNCVDSKPIVMEMEEYYGQTDYACFPILSSCCKLFKKSLWENIRYPIGKLCEDRFTIHRVLFKTERIACITEPLYYYTIREESISHREWTPGMLDDIEACEEQLKFFKEKNFAIAYKSICNNYLNVNSVYIKRIRDAGKPEYKKHYDYLKSLLKKNLKRFKDDVPKDSGLLCYRTAFFDKKKPLTVIYYTLYMLAIYGPKKTIWKVKNRDK